MSIDKIKERIKMIEENNFEINERIYNINQKDYDSITNMDTKDRSKFLGTVGKSDAAYNRIRDRANTFFGSDSKFNIGSENCNETDIPKNDVNNIIQIYKILHNNRLLTGEIDANRNFMPTNGYLACDNIVKSIKGGDVSLEYSDNKLTDLKMVRIKLPSNITSTPMPNNVITAVQQINNLTNFVSGCNVKKSKRIILIISIK